MRLASLIQVGLLAAAVGVSAAYLPGAIDARAVDLVKKANKAEKGPQDLGPKTLFRRLAAAGLVQLDPTGRRIHLAPRDLAERLALDQSGADPFLRDDEIEIWRDVHGEGALSPEDQAALRALYVSGPGPTVRARVADWNALHNIAAVRGGLRAETPVEARAAWRAWSLDDRGQRRPVRVQPGLRFDLFGHFGWGADAPTGGWLTARPSAASGGDALIFARSAPQGATLVVDLLATRAPGAPAVTLHPLSGGALKLDPKVTILCRDASMQIDEGRRRLADASRCDSARDAVSTRLTIGPLPLTGEVRISAAYVSSRPEIFDRAPLEGVRSTPNTCQEDDSTPWSERLTSCWGAGRLQLDLTGAPIALICRNDEAAEKGAYLPVCELDWREQIRPADDAEDEENVPLYNVTVRNGEETTVIATWPRGEDGETDALAAELGLASLLGVDDRDLGGLRDSGGLLDHIRRDANADQAEDVNLSIDLDLQRIAQAALGEGLKAAGDVTDNKNGAPKSRRGALVLMDAGDPCEEEGCLPDDDRGKILAAATFSTTPEPTGPWNALGLEFWRPNDSALAPVAWGRSVREFAPGSTYKVVTALALIRAAFAEGGKGDPEVRRFLQGVAGTAPVLRLDLPDEVRAAPTHVDVRARFADTDGPACAEGSPPESGFVRICNFDGAALTARPPSEDGCPAQAGGGAQMGLCEALTHSYNNWFILLNAWLEARLGGTDELESAAPLIAMNRRLMCEDGGLPQPDGQATAPSTCEERGALNSTFDWREAHNLADGAVRARSIARFRAEPLLLESDPEAPSYSAPTDPFVRAQNVFGQNMQATAVRMAAVMASVASRCVTAPRLVDAGTVLCENLFFDEAIPNEQAIAFMEQTLEKGLANVPRAGTARAALGDAPYLARIRAKTGSAEFGGSGNTAWLVGWLQPTDGPAPSPYAARQVAFACMITSTSGTGGEVCGPAIRAALDAIAGGGG